MGKLGYIIDWDVEDNSVKLHYDELPVKLITNYKVHEYSDDWDTEDIDIEWDFDAYLDEVADALYSKIQEDYPKEAPEDFDEYMEWFSVNIEELLKKYEDTILNINHNKAQDNAQEYVYDHPGEFEQGPDYDDDLYNESLNKKGEKKMKKKLTEARWQHIVPEELATRLRKSINREDYEAVKEAMKDIYDDIYEYLGGEIFDEDDLIQYKDEIDEVEPDEDEINYLLTNLYDFCDNLRIWIPPTGMFDDDEEGEEEESDFDFDDDIDSTWRDELDDDIYKDDLDEDMHEAEVHLDVDTEEDEEADEDEDDFRAKDPDKKVLNEKPLKEDISARPNHDKLLQIVGELHNWDTLANDLLDWMSDDDIGEFITAYGYDEYLFDDGIYDDDDLDGMYTDDDLDEDLGGFISNVGKAVSELNPLKNVLGEDTVKQDGKWVNKGAEGTHGEFKTKKEADAQRKAMFANGLKEDVDDSFEMPENLPESFLKTFQQEKPLEEGVNVNVNVEDNVTTTTTITTPSEGELVPNDETKMSAEDMFVIDADDSIEGLEELV